MRFGEMTPAQVVRYLSVARRFPGLLGTITPAKTFAAYIPTASANLSGDVIRRPLPIATSLINAVVYIIYQFSRQTAYQVQLLE